MIKVSYSVMAILAIVIHCTINRDAILLKKKDNVITKNMLDYQKFLLGVLAFYFTDALWGISDVFGLINILKIDTVCYYIAMSATVVLWCKYVVSYLHQDNFFGKTLRYLGNIFVLLVVGSLILNVRNHIFFWFDKDGVYHAEIARYIVLYFQMVLFLLSTIQAIFITANTHGVKRRRHLAICLFGIAMIYAIYVQIAYPFLPIYVIGYLVGVCFLHVFVEEDEKDEHFKDLKKQMDIVSSMSGIYFCSYYVDLENKTYIEIDNKISENDYIIGKSGDAIETINTLCDCLVLPQYSKEMREFTNLDTLNDRLSDKRYYVSMQFESVHLGWAEGFFIASDRDEKGKLKHVIWAIRTINDEKQKEEKLLYNSYVDELTGLYNRKMYAEDVEEHIDKLMKDDFVYVAMDVNGLKVINDSKGHTAGDELIKGAAICMKKTMGVYGRVYRTGGDEFIALINIDSNKLDDLKDEFEEITANYKGKYIDSVSVSCGYAVWKENKDLSFEEIEKLADNNMYLNKRIYHQKNDSGRRDTNQSAYKALRAMYTKILIVNLTEDKYSIISMNEDEQTKDKGFSDGIFEWLEGFAKSGQVHPDDMELYLEKTNKVFLINYFRFENDLLCFTYRRKIDNVYKVISFEMIKTESYSDDNQNLYLYIKEIFK